MTPILLLPFLGTALGAAMVFLLRGKMSDLLRKLLLGFASGVMVAASVWSLLIPSLEISAEAGGLTWLPAAVGFVLGILFLLLLDTLIPHLHIGAEQPEGLTRNCQWKRTTMLSVAVTLHNIPEGMAVGVILASAMAEGSMISMSAAWALAIGIAIQNFPEGAAIALPMKVATRSKHKAFLFGMGSGAVEPIAAIVGYILASEVAILHPWMLGFAAGAMIFVVAEDLIPESNLSEYPHAGTWGVMLGFILMMVLDVALG